MARKAGRGPFGSELSRTGIQRCSLTEGENLRRTSEQRLGVINLTMPKSLVPKTLQRVTPDLLG